MLEKIDAYIFRLMGVVLGFAGCAALLINNPLDELFSSVYGLLFLVTFGVLGFYSTWALIKDLRS